MCRFLAYIGEPVFLEALLVRPSTSLVRQSMQARQGRTVVNADGCGIGWYGERVEPGVYRGILPAWSDSNLTSLCHQVRSGLFLAHVRAATSGEVSTANCHPFSLREHLFMHNGQIGDYGRIRRHVDALIGEDHYPLRRGTSDSEAIFLIAMALGLDHDPVAAISGALTQVMAVMHDRKAEAPLRFAAAYSDGDQLWAFRWASDGQPPSLYWRTLEAGIVVASEPFDDDGEGWNTLPDASILHAMPGKSAEILSIIHDGGLRLAA